MLGAQALRTKQVRVWTALLLQCITLTLQKVEQKEREKRQREKKKSMEIQRDSIQRLAEYDLRKSNLLNVS